MLKVLRFAVLAIVCAANLSPVHAQGVFDKLKQKAKDKVNGSPATNSGTTNASPGASPAAQTAPSATPDAGTPATASAMHAYTSYDFVPGDKVIVADDFTSAQDGDFPPEWKLVKGQAVVNHQAGYPALLLTAGDYGTFTRVTPRVKQPNYLGTAWTLEYDTYSIIDGGNPKILFTPAGDSPQIEFSDYAAKFDPVSGDSTEGRYPDDIAYKNYNGRWHHVAIVYKQGQLKVYVDQYRVLYVPEAGDAFHELYLAGIGKPDAPVVYRNVRLASGGGMNLVGKQFTDAKIVAHGITFDTDQASLKPESMGTLNQIKKLMDSDPSLKFEIDGHTDNTGTPDRNLQLSNERAEAVKSQLVAMGVDDARLTTKGVGDTKPLGPNVTPADKANNRRVEFVRR